MVFPFILTSLGYSKNDIATSWAIVFSIALFTGGFLTRAPMGVVSDLLSRKQGLLVGTSISIISILLMNFTKNLIVLGFLFALLRTGTHLFPLTTRGYSNETNPSNQQRLNGFVLVGTNLASLFGPIILGLILEISLQTLIIFSCTILLLASMILNFTTPKKLKRKKLSVKKIFYQSVSDLSQIWKLIGVFLIIGLISGIFGAILVPFAATTLNISNIVTDVYVGLIQVSGIVFILISGELKRKLGLFPLIMSGIIFIFSGSLIICIGQYNILTFIIGSILINGGLMVNINSLVTVVTLTASKETAATSFGMASGCFFLGASFIPLIASFIYKTNPFYPYIAIMAICLIVLTLIAHLKEEYKTKKAFTV